MTAVITGKQVRAARRLLSWNGLLLATRAGVDPSSLIRFETGGWLSDEPIQSIQRVLETAGVEFLPGNEVRLLKVAKKPWE